MSASTPTQVNAPAALTPLRETWRQLMRSAEPHAAALRRSIWLLALAAALQGLALACMVPIFGALLPPAGSLADAASWHAALPWLLAFAALMLATQAARWRAQGFDYDGQMAEAIDRLRTRLGEQLRRMPLLQLQDKRTGELSAVVLGSVDENLNYTLMLCTIVANAVITPVAAALAVMAWDWRLGALLLLVFPAVIPLYRWRRRLFQRGLRELAQAGAQCSGDILEYAQGLPVLRTARATGGHAQRLKGSVQRLEDVQAAGQRQGAGPNMLVTSVAEGGMLLVMAAGVSWATQGSLNVAVLAAVAVMLVRFGEPLGAFIVLSAMSELIETALERIEALLAVPPLPQLSPGQTPLRFDIAFEGIDFAYARGGPKVLSGFCATLPAHSMTAFVGPSGGGKTTVTRLLMRHADAQAGSVRIGGVDVRYIAPETLNRLISVVFQDVYLFDDTVLANIRMARPEATDEEVRQAARAAQCLDFIERLPQGWHTRIGEAGGRLSGGERQRISIARALLKNAPIVVLDEPTAALDTESECAVQRAIETLVQERTVIVIAHRLSTIVGARQIIVIDQGRALEAGTHEELLQKNGRYAALWRAQQQAKQWRA